MNFRKINYLSGWRSACLILGAAGLILWLGSAAARAAEPDGAKNKPFRLVSLEQMAPVNSNELGNVRGKQLTGSAQTQDPSSSVAVILWDETRSNRYPPSVSTNTATTGTVSNTFSTAGGYGH